ncbi:hypothetical protein H0H93_005337, partial [Arthromyces matolae]
MTPQDYALLDALNDWRDTATIERYGIPHLKDYGSTLIMPESVLDRILICAQHSKIQSVEELVKETQWDEARLYGDQ